MVSLFKIKTSKKNNTMKELKKLEQYLLIKNFSF